MDLQLEGKRALVTGSSSGIGAGIAKALAQEGAYVVVHGRNQDRAEHLTQEIGQSGGRAVVAIGDLATDEGAQSVVDKVCELLGGVDILVNNAGTFFNRGWEDTTPSQWLEIYNANVVSMVRMIRLLLPEMKQQGWGRIIQIASSVGQYPLPIAADYAATKAASIDMTVSLTKALANTGITVNTVSPGNTDTEGWSDLILVMGASQGWGSDLEEIKKRVVKQGMPTPSGRLGKPKDIGNVVAFLSSPLADYVNGANIRVDGGLVPTVN